ncbi:zincin-like metallopeptidase domain-containing protein [Prevotella melaninogenica]|uniref:zincin-like metallopeptidase domain-containing protein n=1 Tax=Prevotella melaninogenica TaxID=28132 RepID=UPI0021519BDA|nr:ArdC-like ssDNA-binding domain-containing protein [Prevotella melaninogenica]
MPGKKNKKHQSSYERSNKSADNLQKFAEMMSNIITKAKSKNWTQGWLGVKGTILGLPQNITGRTYSGGNSFFLMADTSEKGYNTPVYMTFKQAKDRNLHVNAGEKSVPIFKWGLSIKDEEGKTVSEEDYNAMSKEERDKYSVRPYPKVYHVFNIDQTNLSEVNKKKYDAIVARFKAPDEEVKDSKGMYINDALDRMFKEKAWHCDIRYNKPSSRAFYVPSQDFIVLPMKEQFNTGKTAEEVYRDGMEYYSTALHEMAHSTGHESRLNRQFGAKRTEGYAHEELIAEMTAALVGSTMGFDKKILENNANYLKGWLENLKRNPESITTIMSDVGKASDMIIEKIDEQRVALGQTPLKEGNLEGLTEDLGEETQQSSKISNTEVPQEEVSGATVTSSERQDDDISNILDNKPLIEKVFYGEFNLPEWSIPYLKDGNEYGLTAEQLKTVKDFEKDFPSKLSIEITESSIEGNHNTELGSATTVDKAKVYYFEQHISDLFPTDESTRDRLDKDLSEDNKNRKTLSDLQAQYSNINAQYPAAVNDERTHQLAKRIRQAEQIITAYNANVEAVYGQDFTFSEAANKVMIPQSIYSGQLKPLSIVQDQVSNQEKKVSVPDSLQVPVWEAYEKEKSQTGDFTYQDTAEEYGNMLLKGVENILPRIKGTLTINQWGADVLSAKIENDPRIFDTYIIPEPLKAWLEVSPKEESHSNMQGSSTGKNVDIVAAYAFSTILLQKENQEVGLSFTIDGKQWDNYDEIMQGNSDHVISDEAFAAAWALQSSMGISKHDLSKNAVAVLKDHIDTTEYYGEPTLNGSKGGIELLQSGKVSADYSVKGQQVTVEASPKIEEELHPEQVKEIIEANESFQESKETDEDISLSEDSNPETNVASIAKNIMEKGNVPKEVAEKQATVIADAQQVAIEEKKQKAEQAKQAALKKAEDERRREVEEEKRREEENKQQEKDSGPSSKLLLHAALLLGALELAKGNKGIWMNKAGKSNAEFIGAKRPIMAYNNIMMNLQSDRQGYRSNVYTTYDSAKDAGTAVKQNEESLAFNWVKWDYQHVGTKELISREDYDKLPAEEKEFYTKHKSKEEYGIFNIDQTTMPAGKQADYTALLKDKGAKIDQLTERGVSSMMKFAEKLKSNHPTSMVIARTDSKYQIYGKDASRAGKLLNLPVSQTEENGQKVKSVSFPLDRINDYLPKLVEAKQWVVVAENLDSAELIRQLPNEKEVISNANQTAQRVAKSAGIGYERVMVLQDAAYDKQADKIIVSGMSDKDAGDSRQAALQKANDIYRAVVAATGSEHRLDRMGRNNLLPVDDAKYERFVQDLAAGVLMARQGLPATLSKESMQNVNYLQREIRENPKMLGLIEKDVNNAIESIDKHLKQEIVKYEDIRKELTPKDLIVSPKQYKISSDLAKIPDIGSKQIVIVRDKAKGAADVILPEGASLDDDVEISGIRKDRIKIALGKEGISDVKFYNAGGGLGLNETNDYYKGKEVSVDKLKQYDFSQHRDIDVKPQIEAAKVANIKLFTPIKDDKGQYAFFFKVDNEPSFAVYPNEAHKRAYFDARNTDQKKEIHEALAQKYYSVAQKHPEIKVDLIMPKVPAVDMSKIERPTITKDRDDPNKKYVMATIDGKLMKEPISKDQWNKMWLADDMAEYKKAVAAVTFAPFLKVEEKNENPIKQEKQENVSSNQEQTLSQSEDTNEEDVQQEETTPRTVKPRGMGIG